MIVYHVHQIVVPFFYVGWVACLAHLVSGCLVLPSLARQDLRATAAKLIQVCFQLSTLGFGVTSPSKSVSIMLSTPAHVTSGM